jgi:pyridoxine 5'-phosphate synthase PdxJ
MTELNIGHAIVSRAVFVGMRKAVAEMKAAMNHFSRGQDHV